MSRRSLRTCNVPGCPTETTRSRCAEHEAEARAAQDASRGTRTERGLDNPWLRLAAAAIHAHVAANGWVCPGHNRPPHPVEPGQLTGDHIVPRSVAPERAHDPTNIGVLCLSCNSAKGAHGHDRSSAKPERRVYRTSSSSLR